MNGFMNFIKDTFPAFLEWMLFFISNSFQLPSVAEVAFLGSILALALGVMFVCDRLMKKHNSRYTGGLLLTFFPKAGVLLLYGAGILFAWVLLASLMVFFWPLINS